MSRPALLVAAVAVSLAPASADAGVFKLYAEAQGGGVVGKGTSGDVTASTVDASFFEKAPHGMYGALVGGQFLFLNVEIQHHQFTNGDRLSTWTQFGGGLRFEIPMGTLTPEDKAAGKGSYAEMGFGLNFGVGTGQQVMPPLSNDEVTDKAFLVQGRLGIGKHLNKIFDIGVAVPVSWGYFFKSGSGAAANDLSTHYQSVQAEAMLYLRANIRFL
ncbi:MAG: hypothetical protein SFX73_28370 [Kofleriaceae bacterium]|nr:hypothetical protein [Kofleriaceae bacterium]